ncbi:MAG: MFS transporter, partial [Actinobacteria bacterium]|nr:MFS transporter [Actinomycetota bacterium]
TAAGAEAGAELGWRIALLATGALILPALAVWIWATRGGSAQAASPAPGDTATADAAAVAAAAATDHRAGRRIWGDRLAWLVSVYMGTQSAAFYMLSAWLAPYSTGMGRSAVLAGIDVMIYQLMGVAGSMLLPLLNRGRMRRWTPALIPAITLLSAIGMLAAPGVLPLWLVTAGLSTGAALTIALTLTATRSRTAQHAAALSGMAQSVGYLIATIGPIAFGWLHGLNGSWLAPFALVWLSLAVQLGSGLIVGKPRFVLESR